MANTSDLELMSDVDSRSLFQESTDEQPSSPRSRPFRLGAVAGSVTLAVLMCSAVLWFRAVSSRGAKDGKLSDTVGLLGHGSTSTAYAPMSGSGNTAIVPDVAGPSGPKPKTWQNIPNRVFVNQGGDAGVSYGNTQSCIDACQASTTCNSFAQCGGTCYLKDAVQTGYEPMEDNAYCSSYFFASGYFPSDPSLLQPNTDAPLEFYIYRTQTGNFYPPANTNAASIGGVMWYLHNEVIKTCDGSGFLADGGEPGDRKFQINMIRRMKIKMKTTNPLKKYGLNFGALQSFDSGETTGPHLYTAASGVGTGFASTPEWDTLGYFVGCGFIGQWPHDSEPGGWTSGPSYPNCVWYSFPGPCPQMPYKGEPTWCETKYPGGMCMPDSTTLGVGATGQGNCTWEYEEAGWIDVDELVGIKPKWPDRKTFCSECAGEGGPYEPAAWQPNSKCQFSWWGTNIWDDKAGNANRVQQALDAFKKKYPDSPTETELPTPLCDFNKAKYEQAAGHQFPS